jgi:hypothetical protein
MATGGADNRISGPSSTVNTLVYLNMGQIYALAGVYQLALRRFIYRVHFRLL